MEYGFQIKMKVVPSEGGIVKNGSQIGEKVIGI
jgi:hypothetical protein